MCGGQCPSRNIEPRTKQARMKRDATVFLKWVRLPGTRDKGQWRIVTVGNSRVQHGRKLYETKGKTFGKLWTVLTATEFQKWGGGPAGEVGRGDILANLPTGSTLWLFVNSATFTAETRFLAAEIALFCMVRLNQNFSLIWRLTLGSDYRKSRTITGFRINI